MFSCQSSCCLDHISQSSFITPLLFTRSFIIISLRSCFVKNFFNYFFALDFSNPQQLLYHIIFKTFCQELFSNVMMYVLIVLRQQLLHLTTFRHCLSRTFFKYFFRCYYILCCLTGNDLYTTIIFNQCQHFFYVFSIHLLFAL